MISSKYANALYFTPRTPWGTRVQRRALRSHMQASEDVPLAPDKRPKPMPKAMQSPVGQAGLDKLQASANNAKMMDQNGVPRSLQSQISPERAKEIMDPSRKPLPAPQIPSMTNRAFPTTQPRPEQVPLRPSGSGVVQAKSPNEQMDQQARKSGGYQQVIPKPEQKVPEPPINFYWGKDFKGVGKTFRW